MAISSKNYPKAVPCHSPEELTAQNARLNLLNEELAAQTKRLTQGNDDLAKRADRLRAWTLRLIGVCVVLLVVSAASVALACKSSGLFSPAPQASSGFNNVQPVASAPVDGKNGLSPVIIPKIAPTELPPNAFAKPDSAAATSSDKAGYLEALGGLSATHLYQSQLNIGLLADGVESEVYSVAEANKNLKTIVSMMKLVDSQLAKMTQTGLDADDQESIRQIQAVAVLLHTQADALRAYWAGGEKVQADRYHKARNAARQGLSRVMGID